MRIIQTLGSLVPEYGGPARSVPNLALALADEGIEVIILSIDLGSNYSSPLIPVHPLLKTVLVPAKVTVGLRAALIPGFRQELDLLCRDQRNLLIHDHGIWLPQNGITAQIARSHDIPLIVSPRGMLEPWAMKFRRWRKLVAWHLFQQRRFRLADILHATSQAEAQSIRDLGISKPICIIPNGTLLPDTVLENKGQARSIKRILFLSRIHPKKGLQTLVQAMGLLDHHGWELVIAGYNEDNYQMEVEAAVTDAGLSDVIKFHGPVPDQEKWDFYPQFDLFILPSFSENFGIVVAEALACGLPVITTTGTPWQDLERYNCGWWVKPTVEAIAKALQAAIELSDDQRRSMGVRGKKLVESKYSWQAIARKMIDVYRYLLEDTDPPKTIFFS